LEENYNDSKVSGVTVLKCTDVLEFGSPGGGWVFLSSVSERKGCMERLLHLNIDIERSNHYSHENVPEINA